MFNKNKKRFYIASFIILLILFIAALFNTKLLSQNLIDRKSTPVAKTAITTVQSSPEVQRKKYSENEARKFFNNYIELEQKFDPAIFDLYAEDGILKATRVYPDGMVREIQLTKEQLKQLALAALPLGKQRNDINTYSDIKHKVNDDSIKIAATRYNHYKKYTSDYSMILKYVGDELKIKEESYETIP